MAEQLLGRIFASLIWITAISLLLVKAHRSAQASYRLQAVGAAGLLAVLALNHEPWLWLDVGVVLAIKELIIPRILSSHREVASQDYGAKSAVGMAFVLMVAGIVTAASLALGEVPGLAHPLMSGVLIGAWFISFIHLSARYETWSLSWALLSLDTVSGALAVSVSGPLGEFVGVGIELAALAMAVLLAWLSRKIFTLMQTTDVRDVEELTG